LSKTLTILPFKLIPRFYAPWCGHCKNLQPAFEKAAKSLKGLAKVAAVNCDDEMNKAFCGSMGVQGFPTLKVIRPGAKKGRPRVEEYQGARTAKAMVETMIDKIPNHVDKLTSEKLDKWLTEGNDTSKAILFTKKGATSALYRSLAIDFLGSMSFAQMRNSEVAVEDVFGVTEFPKLVLLPGGDKDSIVYEGKMEKEPMLAFLSQVATPNQDPAPIAPKKAKSTKKDAKADEANKKKAKKAEEAEKARDKEESKTNSEQKVLNEDIPVEGSEEKGEAASEAPVVPPLPFIETNDNLRELCFNPKASTCLIALMPDIGPEGEFSHSIVVGLSSLQTIHHKYTSKKQAIFPFYVVPADNEVNTYLRKTLQSGGQYMLGNTAALEIMVVNAKRGWWRRYRSEVGPESGFGVNDIELWIDHVKSGDGHKDPVPKSALKGEDTVVDKVKEAVAETKEKVAEAVADIIDNVKPDGEPSADESTPEAAPAEEPTAKPTPEAVPIASDTEAHDEL
jgi:protein disulfide-isomerase A6